MAKIILDAGHGGNDLGDAYGSRYEKDDNLVLTLAVGAILMQYGYDVEYIRTNDIYVSIDYRVMIANELSGDFLLSIHRIIGELVISESGLGFYVLELGGVAEQAAINIANELRPIGFEHYSIGVRSENLLIKETKVPTLMMGIGYLNSDYDNEFFDTHIQEIAMAIAQGIMETIPLNCTQDCETNNNTKDISTEENINSYVLYAVQVGRYMKYSNAILLYNDLLHRGYPAQLIFQKPFYLVMVGNSEDLSYIEDLEYCLRLDGFSTIVVIM